MPTHPFFEKLALAIKQYRQQNLLALFLSDVVSPTAKAWEQA